MTFKTLNSPKMRKEAQIFFFKLLPFLKKNQQKKDPRNYNTLVENFKSRVQME